MSKYRSPEHTILDMYEASIIGGRKTGSRGLAFRKSSTSKPDDWHDKRGTDVGASRNYANQQASYNKELESEKNKEKEVDKRTREAEQRRKEAMNMAKEETESYINEEMHQDYNLKKTGKKSTIAHPDGKSTHELYHNDKKIATIEPYSAYKDTKKPGSRIVSSRKDVTRYVLTSHVPDLNIRSDIRYGWSSPKDAAEGFIKRHQDHLSKNEETEQLEEAKIKGSRTPGRSLLDDPRVKKALMLQKTLQGKGSLAPKASDKKEVTKEEAEASGTVERRKIKNVARPDDSDPTSSKSKLSKQAEIKNKVIDEGKMLKSDKKFGIPDSIIEAAKAIMNGKTEVDTKPETNDRDNDDVDESKKKGKKKLDPVGKEDDDVDNDGDTDSSDSYLKNRRKAIGKAMKEEAEQIDELKKSTLASYANKAADDATKHSYIAGKTGDVDKAAKASKRIRGIMTATKKMSEEVDIDDLTEEQLEEVLKKSDPAGKWISDFVHSKDPKFAGKSKKERMKQALGAYYAKQRNEEVEQVDEGKWNYPKNLTRPLIDPYLGRSGQPERAARKEIRKKIKAQRHKDLMTGKTHNKEEVEQVDEVSKTLLKSYKKEVGPQLKKNQKVGDTKRSNRETGDKLATKKIVGYGVKVPATEEVDFSDDEIARLEEIAKKFD
jgi:hypothetical protein